MTRPGTLGELRSSGWQSRPVKHEVRDNVIRRIASGQPVVEGVVGYDDTVLPQLENALLAAHDVIFLGERGQAKPQQGITPTDYRENRKVTIRVAGPVSGASDWLFPEETLMPVGNGKGAMLELVVPAGGVRIVEFKTK